MATPSKVRLTQIEQGEILKEMIVWYRSQQSGFASRFNSLRRRSRQAARRAGFSPRDIAQLIQDTRSSGGKA